MSLEQPKSPELDQLTEKRKELEKLLSSSRDESEELRVEELLRELNKTDNANKYRLFICGLTGAKEVFRQARTEQENYTRAGDADFF